MSLVKNVLLTYGFSWDPDRQDRDVLDPAAYGRDGGTFLVLEKGDEILGTIAARRLDDDRVELRRMYLHPAFWGEGWGSRLLEALLDWARGAGFDRMELETDPRFDRSIGFYERKGFRRVTAPEGDWDGPLRYFQYLRRSAHA
ncbi:MAG: GNAT family N-acetyltransferase [Candidatus Sericytochromatia bacterium]|uniref:GNAT family N-acetyltransferase n=1 Tax=Candidatus Tanganyikabacteria bacterium TaxID=2961651 RepID=A0A937X2K8_9BACT|nr:GNAT family N-acetyltransferase [Candidatus Tanganyikabacteria bacterium]